MKADCIPETGVSETCLFPLGVSESKLGSKKKKGSGKHGLLQLNPDCRIAWGNLPVFLQCFRAWTVGSYMMECNYEAHAQANFESENQPWGSASGMNARSDRVLNSHFLRVNISPKWLVSEKHSKTMQEMTNSFHNQWLTPRLPEQGLVKHLVLGEFGSGCGAIKWPKH